jgi:hypothetical protein
LALVVEHLFSKIESFIRSKYESRRWAVSGPQPTDPSVLEEGGAGASPAQVASPVRLEEPVSWGLRFIWLTGFPWPIAFSPLPRLPAAPLPLQPDLPNPRLNSLHQPPAPRMLTRFSPPNLFFALSNLLPRKLPRFSLPSSSLTPLSLLPKPPLLSQHPPPPSSTSTFTPLRLLLLLPRPTRTLDRKRTTSCRFSARRLRPPLLLSLGEEGPEGTAGEEEG